MTKWLLRLWYALLRRIDVEILWPSCVKLAPDIDHARATFATHAFADKAWLTLGEDEIILQIDALPAFLGEVA